MGLNKGGVPGRRNKKITVAEADSYRVALREKAESGDTMAQAAIYLSFVIEQSDRERNREVILKLDEIDFNEGGKEGELVEFEKTDEGEW